MRIHCKSNYVIDQEEVDDELLSQVAAIEAHALSTKRRKITTTASTMPSQTAVLSINKNPNEDNEGIYMAALKGSESLLCKRTGTGLLRLGAANGRVVIVPAGSDGDFASGVNSRSDGGDSCFKCGKSGHWARDCTELLGRGGGEGYNGKLRVDDGVLVDEKACPCGLGTCLVLTANTERNRGRKFYKCPVRQENGGCGFFEWCENASGNSEMTYGSQQYASNSSLADLLCPCGAGTCSIRTAKTGENIGRQFYCCPKGQANSCGYFKWCEENSIATSFQGSAAIAYNKMSDGNNASHPPRSGSSCFKCGNEGHWAKDCSVSSSKVPAELGGRSSSSQTCYKCGQSGHWARDCSMC